MSGLPNGRVSETGNRSAAALVIAASKFSMAAIGIERPHANQRT
jgi:hypothetical protein